MIKILKHPPLIYSNAQVSLLFDKFMNNKLWQANTSNV